ncbi:MAG: hypothetical protein M1816_008041 [Peltula sp. TS41687]|nr:MAG: hypothetical protein M1816_008041 [Peltula sp. TS41687]
MSTTIPGSGSFQLDGRTASSMNTRASRANPSWSFTPGESTSRSESQPTPCIPKRRERTHLTKADKLVLVRLCVQHQETYKRGTITTWWKMIAELFRAETGKEIRSPDTTVKTLMTAREREVEEGAPQEGTETGRTVQSDLKRAVDVFRERLLSYENQQEQQKEQQRKTPKELLLLRSDTIGGGRARKHRDSNHMLRSLNKKRGAVAVELDTDAEEEEEEDEEDDEEASHHQRNPLTPRRRRRRRRQQQQQQRPRQTTITIENPSVERMAESLERLIAQQVMAKTQQQPDVTGASLDAMSVTRRLEVTESRLANVETVLQQQNSLMEVQRSMMERLLAAVERPAG